MKVILLIMTLFSCAIAQDSDSVIWELENYNGWNLPFKKTFELEALDPSINFPLSNYNLEIDPSAYFSVVFTDLDINKEVEEPVLLNYTFYGEKNFAANGTWTDMRVKFNKAQGTEGFGDYNVTIKIFLAYAKPPESGLDGTLGIAVTGWYDRCIMC